jgi:predicted anti-sigma-YlaC factor YlaD
MNPDPTDTQSPHLDLGDLIAKANGVSIGDAAREHLAGCEQCRLEADRWNLVADGVRGLAAAAQEGAPPEAAGATAVPLAPPARRVRRRVPAPLARRALLVVGSVAAALVLLVGIGVGTGFMQVHLGGGGSGSEPVLTAVSGCPVLEQAAGTLEQVSGGSLVIKTASGQPLTVTTTTATKTSAGGALLADITDGASVTVFGTTSDGTIAASAVFIGNTAQAHLNPPTGAVTVKGMAADVSAAGFTVVTSDGTQVPVTTSSGTAVGLLDASLSRLPAGATILAIGYAGPHGTLSAQGVVGIVQLPQGGRQVHAQVHMSVKNCSHTAIDHAILLAAGG